MGRDDRSMLAPLRFGEFTLDEAGFELRRNDQPVAIEPRALRLLLHLARNRQRAVSRDELTAVLWPGLTVSEESLKQAIHLARRTVEEAGGKQSVIATLRGHGYRFVADLDDSPAQLEPTRSSSAQLAPFVGRVNELDRLAVLLNEVGRGTARVVALSGEAGIGKTTLARRWAESAATAGYAVARGRSDSDCGAPSYWSWIQVLRELLPRPEIDIVAHRAPRRLANTQLLLRNEAISESPMVEAQGRRLWLSDDIAEVLRIFSTACPLLILLEDLHAADESSLLLLRFLSRHLETSRVMIVGTFRSSELSSDHPLTAALIELRRLPWFEGIELGGLSTPEIAELIDRRAVAPLIGELQRRTQGNPLFLRELLRQCASRLEPEWFARGDAVAALDRSAVPVGVRELVGQRVASMAPDTRAIFEAAAVLGDSFQPADAAYLCGQRPTIIADHLETLRRQGFFQSVAPTTTEQQFAHPIVREAALALLPAARAQKLHDKAVKRIERGGQDEIHRQLPQLAHHALAAVPHGPVARAIRYGKAAAAHAASQFAYEDAGKLYRRTLTAAEQSARPSWLERGELLVALGEVAARTADHAATRDAAEEAFRIGRRLGRPDLCARAAACAVGPTLLRLQTGTVDERHIELLEDALQSLSPSDKFRRIELYSQLAMALYWSSDTYRCITAADTAVALAEKLRKPGPLAQALHARCISRWRPSAGRPDAAAVRAAIAAADRADEVDLAMSCTVRLAHVLTETGDIAGLGAALSDLSRRAEDMRYPQARLWPLMLQASTHVRRHKVEEAAAMVASVPAAARDAWEAEAAPYYAMLLGLLRREQGHVEDLAEVLERLAGVVPKFLIDAPLPMIFGARGEFERSLQEYQRLVAQRPWESSDHMGTIASLTMIAEPASRLGDMDTATGIYPVLAPHAGEYAVLSGVGGMLGPVTYTLGQLCGVMKRYDEAIAHFECSLDECRRAGLDTDVARTKLAWARVLMARDGRGDRRRARALGAEAQSKAEKLNNLLLVADAATFNSGSDLPVLAQRA